jgi:D-3-phosphoglycerate dehydrogenase/C-terminal binding protein
MLTAALRAGQFGGAALDVLPREPADPAHPLIAAWRAGEDWVRGRLVLSPHAAFYSPAAAVDLRRKSVQTVLAVLRHGRVQNCVNAAMLVRR